MRLTRFHLFLLGGLILAIGGPVAFTQPGPPGGFSGGGRKSRDPAEMFARYANGKDVIVVAEVQSTSRWMPTEQVRERMNAFLQKKGVTDGKMTLALFTEYSDEMRQEMMEKFRKGGFGGMPGGPSPAIPGSATPGAATPMPANPADLEAQAKELFKQLDTNNDGKLSADEMQAASRMGKSRIYDQRDRWDANKDGSIDLAEFTTYYKDQMSRGSAGSGPLPQEAAPPEEDKRPVVYRVGKLPAELKAAAPWFEQLDKDKDGQVGLYEWKASGRPLKDFLAMDANADGFITAEELMRYLKINKKDDKKGTDGQSTTAVAAAGTSDGSTPSMNGRGRGRGGPRSGGPGGGQRGRFRGGSWGGPGGR